MINTNTSPKTYTVSNPHYGITIRIDTKHRDYIPSISELKYFINQALMKYKHQFGMEKLRELKEGFFKEFMKLVRREQFQVT